MSQENFQETLSTNFCRRVKLHLDDTRVSGEFNLNIRMRKHFPPLLTDVITFRTCRGRGICSGRIIGRGRGGGGAIGDNKIA